MVAESKRKPVDWEAVEKDYRTGVRSIRDIGAQHGCSHTAIQKRADKEGWTRDLGAKIRASAEAKVAKALVAKEVTAETKATERETIEANAQAIASVVIGHRSDIRRHREVATALLDELAHQTANVELYEQLGEILRSPDEKGLDKLNELYQKAISLPGRINNIQSLSVTLKNLLTLERQAFNIDGARDDEPPKDAGSQESLTEVARRMAFILASGVALQEKSNADD